jgi:hypothetical protein
MNLLNIDPSGAPVAVCGRLSRQGKAPAGLPGLGDLRSG